MAIIFSVIRYFHVALNLHIFDGNPEHHTKNGAANIIWESNWENKKYPLRLNMLEKWPLISTAVKIPKNIFK